LATQHALFCGEKYLPEKTGEEWDDTIVGEEELIFVEQGAPSFERFELSLEFLDADDAIDEPNTRVFKEIFVLSLWVFGNEANGGCTGVNKRIFDGAINSISLKI
jgi:hypothetical protein